MSVAVSHTHKDTVQFDRFSIIAAQRLDSVHLQQLIVYWLSIGR